MALLERAEGVEALRSGEAFVDLSSWRKVAVSGRDAGPWLNDLVSAEVSDLGAGAARHSLLLSPTGRIRAAFTVAAPDGEVLLLQDPGQAASIETLLAPYVLSSDVQLDDRTDAFALFAFPGGSVALNIPGAIFCSPSCTGAGVDVVASAEEHDVLLRSLSNAYVLAGPENLEAWRVAAGIPRFGVDALDVDLPEEGGLGGSVAFDKGCYLGQEAVAKVRNLGHPRRILLHLVADDIVAPGEDVDVEGERMGEVSSAWSDDGRTWLLARIRWEGRKGPFRSAGGARLTPLSPL
jgi:folate-binding protein YgfZ